MDYWKNIAIQAFLAFKFLFIVELSWELYLTIMFMANHQLILAGAATIFAPYIVSAWMIIIFGLLISSLLLINTSRVFKFRRILSVSFLSAASLLNLSIMVFSIINPFVSIPIAFIFGLDSTWALALIYFKYKIYFKYGNEVPYRWWNKE